MENWNLKELNAKLPTLKSLYDILVDNKGYYLPSFDSHSCTREYLLKIVKDEKTFKVERKFITEPPQIKQKKTVEELMEIAGDLLKEKNLTLGFDGNNQPDKKWIIKVIHYLSPKHPIFVFEDVEVKRDFPEK